MATHNASPTAPPPVLTKPTPAIDRAIREQIESLDMPSSLREAMIYASEGGKRIRPLLAWHCGAAAGGQGEHTLPAGVAVELIHAFSLVHDDLPAMDDDDLRRGRPTLHRKTSEAMAILAGDAMATLAIGSLAWRVRCPTLASSLTVELARASLDMISGQVLDTLGEHGDEAPEGNHHRLLRIHRLKTGALITASCRMGAMCGLGSEATHDRTESVLDAITRYGEAIGLMFQIVDDLLDVEQSADHTGKQTGKDADAGKLTYPGVMGVEASKREVERLRASALESLDVLGPGAAALAELAHWLAIRTR